MAHSNTQPKSGPGEGQQYLQNQDVDDPMTLAQLDLLLSDVATSAFPTPFPSTPLSRSVKSGVQVCEGDPACNSVCHQKHYNDLYHILYPNCHSNFLRALPQRQPSTGLQSENLDGYQYFPNGLPRAFTVSTTATRFKRKASQRHRLALKRARTAQAYKSPMKLGSPGKSATEVPSKTTSTNMQSNFVDNSEYGVFPHELPKLDSLFPNDDRTVGTFTSPSTNVLMIPQNEFKQNHQHEKQGQHDEALPQGNVPTRHSAIDVPHEALPRAPTLCSPVTVIHGSPKTFNN